MSAAQKTTSTAPKNLERSSKSPSDMPFHRGNYRWLFIGVTILLVGYVGLMIPGEFVDSKQFSFALYVAPWLIVGGFITLIYAILKK